MDPLYVVIGIALFWAGFVMGMDHVRERRRMCSCERGYVTATQGATAADEAAGRFVISRGASSAEAQGFVSDMDSLVGRQ